MKNIFISLLLIFTSCTVIKSIGNIIVPMPKNKCNVISCYDKIVIGTSDINLCFNHLYQICYSIRFLDEEGRKLTCKEIFNDPNMDDEKFLIYDDKLKTIAKDFIPFY